MVSKIAEFDFEVGMLILISLRISRCLGRFDVNILTKNILWEVQVIYKTKTKLDTDEDAGVNNI
jgi:hypothetical protein